MTFEEGTEIVYKPRGVEPGTLFYGILDRLDPHLSVSSFATPTYLACDGYGWMEWIEHRPCSDEQAVARYYERAGALVCLTYLLEFTDCHYENLIAHGEYPVLVDCETIAHPFAATAASERLPELAPLVTESIHLSLLLPFDVEPSDIDADVDPAAVSKLGMEGMSGIGTDADPVRLSAVTNPRIEAANTDVMSISHERPTIHRADNTPHLEGSAQRPGEYLDAIVTGFEETYRTVRRLHEDGRFREEILRDGSLERIENRFVYRATRRYVSVIDALLSRDPLRDGVRFSVEMERLAAPFFTDLISDDRYWPIYERERAALKRLDPPRITCHVDGRVPSFDGDPIRISVDRSGYDRCRRRLDSMSESDLRRQRRLLRECFDGTDR
ncbi:hypothetical protein HTG_00510 [Natrinema mahii]|nr:hypothetical protein HTG_00510 [Natrinema mahii]